MQPVAAEWWLRPVSNAARVGEQRAVVWKRVYFSPFLASLSRFGVGTRPPKVPQAPNPVSSISTKSTLGAPAGAFVTGMVPIVESLYVRPIVPGNFGSGTGSTCEPPIARPVGFSWPEAVSHPSIAPAASIVAAATVVRVRMMSAPLDVQGSAPAPPG